MTLALQAASIVVAIAAAVIAVREVRLLLRGIETQLRVQSFLSFTGRYNEIVRDLPIDVLGGGGSGIALGGILDEKERARILVGIKRYFDLCSEEYFLRHEGMLKEPEWSEWERFLSANLGREIVMEVWRLIEGDGYSEGFRKHVELLAGKNKAGGLR